MCTLTRSEEVGGTACLFALTLLSMAFNKMIRAAGAKEAELQGASSVVRGNPVMEAIRGEM